MSVHPLETAHRQHEAYRHGEQRPLGGYAALLTTYGTLTATATLLVRRKGRLGRLAPTDLALLAVSTYRVSRLITKDSVTAVVRAPFTTYEEPAGEGEVNESVRGDGIRHAVGELVTCPFCLGQWVATAGATAFALAPDVSRFAAGICVAATASEVLQLLYSKAKETLA